MSTTNVKIKKGESVWTALQDAGWSDKEIQRLGLVGKVASANKLSDPDQVEIGQVLRVPAKQAKADSANGRAAYASARQRKNAQDYPVEKAEMDHEDALIGRNMLGRVASQAKADSANGRAAYASARQGIASFTERMRQYGADPTQPSSATAPRATKSALAQAGGQSAEKAAKEALLKATKWRGR